MYSKPVPSKLIKLKMVKFLKIDAFYMLRHAINALKVLMPNGLFVIWELVDD